MSRQQTLAWRPVLFCFLQIDGHVFRFEEFKRLALLGNYCLDPRLSFILLRCDAVQTRNPTISLGSEDFCQRLNVYTVFIKILGMVTIMCKIMHPEAQSVSRTKFQV